MKAPQVTFLDTPPYVAVATLKRFPADCTVFARMRTDREFRMRIAGDGQQNQWDPAETALKESAWSVLGDLSARAYAKEDLRGADARRYRCDDWGSLTVELKTAARLYGAGSTGITRVNKLWLYKSKGEEIIPERLDTAIVMAVPMDRDMIARSPSPSADAATGTGYARMAFVTSCVVTFIRKLGWTAAGCGNDTALSVPLAIDSGLGECGRNGILTTPERGSCIRICKVFTDMPLVPDRPISFGMAERCEKCRRCARACPVGAICHGNPTARAPGPSSNPGVVKWPVDGEKCRQFWSTNGNSCSNCIKACPYS